MINIFNVKDRSFAFKFEASITFGGNYLFTINEKSIAVNISGVDFYWTSNG